MSTLPARLGKYHVLERIAQGGMAEIYKAKSVGIAGFEKILAVKRILPSFAREPRFIRSFIDEARIAVTLNHRNIVQVFDFGKADGELYLAMELIEGVDLRTALTHASQKQLGIPAAVACYLLSDLAAGLDYAHRKSDGDGHPLGIVHCDVSPQNVMLSYEGFVKVLDFGVSRARFSATPHEKRLRGKPRYMAPEQTRGDPPTAATDVFALGILCWELLTGMKLFDGPDLPAILAAVRRAEAPPVASLNPEVPEALSRAIATALAARPEDRGGAADLGALLGRTARDLTGTPGSRAVSDWLALALDHFGDEEATTTEALAPELGEPAAVPTGTHTIIVEEPIEPPATASAALVEQRRVVATVARIDGADEDSRRELARALAELCYKHGAVVHAQGEAAVEAVFGLEVLGEDDIASAMHFSVDAVELARETAGAGGQAVGLTLRLATRAGLVAQRAGEAVRLYGDALAEARLLAREAEPGRPLLTGGTGRLASAQFEFRELPARRHLRRRLRVFELTGKRGFDDRARALRERRGRLVGREPELERLAAAYARAVAEARPVVLTVCGDAGVGKSRLIAELDARLATAHPAPRVLAVTASPGARDAPFSLVTDLCQVALNLPPGRGQAARANLGQRLRFVLERADCDRSARDECLAAIDLATELRDGALVGPVQASADLRQRVAGALGGLLATLARGQPLFAAIEDLHLADAASLSALATALSPAGPPGPALFLLTTRATDGPIAGGEDLELGELDGAARRVLIADRLAEAASEEAIGAIDRRAGGNPLFIEELATCVREVGTGPIPPTVRDVLLARVDRLSAGAKAGLQHAAVLGPSFRLALLEELLGPTVQDHVVELTDEELVVRLDFASAAGDEGELAFRHGLLQEAVYEALTPATRRRIHARIGELYVNRLAAGREEPPALVARHLELGGDRARAAELWLRAGQAALTAAHAAAARDAFGRALELDEALGQAAQARRLAALLGREQAHRELGELDASAADLARLELLAAGDRELLAEIRTRHAARALRLGDYAAATAAALQAEHEAAAAGSVRLRGEALRLAGEALERTGDFDRGLEVLGRAIELFRQCGDGPAETRARIAIGRNHLSRSRYDEAWRAYQPILADVDAAADPWLERVVRNHVAVIQLCRGELEAAMGSARRSLELCRFYGDHARAGDNLSVCGVILTEVGQYPAAGERFAEALELLERTASRWSRADCLVYAGIHRALAGDAVAGLRAIDEARALAGELGAPYVAANAELGRAQVFLHRGGEGDPARALEAADAALVRARGAAMTGAEIVALARRAEALLAAGDAAAARAPADEACARLAAQRFLETAEEEVYFTRHRVLARLGDPEAEPALAQARHEVARKLALLRQPEWRRSYVEDVALHRRIRAPGP